MSKNTQTWKLHYSTTIPRHYSNVIKAIIIGNDWELLENDDAYSTGMRATEIIDNFLHDDIQEDFVLLREQVVESEIEDGSDIELDDCYTDDTIYK